MRPVVPPFQRGAGFGTLGASFMEPVLPAPVPLAPATWGAWLTLVLLCAAASLGVAHLARRRAARRHRRVARRELAALRSAWHNAAGAARARILERLPLLLKGCALGSFERGRVASLAGHAWRDFLCRTAPGAGFEGAPGGALVALCERGAACVAEAQVPALFNAAERWIARHHV